MTERSPTAVRLFWTFVIGGAMSLKLGAPAAIATGTIMFAILWYRLDRPRRFRSRVRRIARRHGRMLALRRRQERFVDAYGNTIEDGWLRERAYFVERTILPQLDAAGFAEEADAQWETMSLIVERVARSIRLAPETSAPEDGIAYERHCAELLGRAGWRAHTTSASGDQGADVVAERAGIRFVLQCKRYGKPVGNAAVQEISAAARYWSADMSAVVSNAGFTPAARKLAAATGVQLLHHDDLAELRPVRPAGRLPAPV